MCLYLCSDWGCLVHQYFFFLIAVILAIKFYRVFSQETGPRWQQQCDVLLKPTQQTMSVWTKPNKKEHVTVMNWGKSEQRYGGEGQSWKKNTGNFITVCIKLPIVGYAGWFTSSMLHILKLVL